MPYAVTDKNSTRLAEHGSVLDAKRSLPQVTEWRPDERRKMGWNGWVGDPAQFSAPDFMITWEDEGIAAGVPGHGRGLTSPRRQPARIVDGVTASYTDVWEVICYDCGDDHNMNYDELPAELQKIRGPYGSQEAAILATWHHDFDLVSRPGNDLVQLALFADYASNLRLYPRLHAYLRASWVPLLAAWGRNDEIFGPAGAW